jgi:hypothetical protein
MVHDALIGGSAGVGKIENGKYFVGHHGHFTEVSRSAYQFSRWHEFTAGIMFVIALFIILDMVLSKRKWGDMNWGNTRRAKSK